MIIEIQHSADILLIIIVIIISVSIPTFVALIYWMKRWKYERDVAYNVLLKRSASTDSVAKEITAFDFQYRKILDDLSTKNFQLKQVHTKLEIEKAIITFKF